MINEEKQGLNDSLSGSSSGPWWKPAMQIFSEVSTWIAVPIIVALFAGKALDRHYGTQPVIFLIFAGLGFLVTCFGMFRVVKNYVNKLKYTDPTTLKATTGEEKNN